MLSQKGPLSALWRPVSPSGLDGGESQELTTSRTRDVAEARKQVAQTETRERYVPSNELKRSVPKHMRRGLLYHVTLDALAKDSEKALSLLQEREAIRRTMLRR